MLTIVVLLSGKHRLPWLAQALASIPTDSPVITAVHVMHQDGPWRWAPELRRQVEANPKVKIMEFAQRLHFVANFNRCINQVTTKWALLLPDDDFLMTDALKNMLELSSDALASNRGFIAYGWYYCREGRFLGDYVRRYSTAYLSRYTPKLCTTLINVERLRAVGGFCAQYGGFCDAVLFARLAYAFNAWYSPTPTGAYRLHESQLSCNTSQIYEPFFDATLKALVACTNSGEEAAALARRMQRLLLSVSPGPLGRAFDSLKFRLLGRAMPEPAMQRSPVRLLADF